MTRNFIEFNSPLVTASFIADQGRRKITGIVIPWGETAHNGGKYWRFHRGGFLAPKDLKRAKLLRDHDHSQAHGYTLKFEDTDAGLVGTFSVAPGPDGDKVLTLAEHGTLDGLSGGFEWHPDDVVPDPENPGAWLVMRYTLGETSLTAMPAFKDSRLTSVKASESTETEPVMPEPTTPQAAPANEPVTPSQAPPTSVPEATTALEQVATPAGGNFSVDDMLRILEATRANGQFTEVRNGAVTPAAAPAVIEARPVVDPTTQEVKPTGASFVAEPLPYRFSYERPFAGQPGRHVFHASQHDFSTDLYNAINKRSGVDLDAAVKRVNDLVRRTFAVSVANVASVTPNKDRADLWVPQMDYATPLWDMINAGTLQDGTPFDIPKFSSASGLVSAATAGTEPSPGAMAVTTQTITPTQLWGKVEIERQAIRRGGNPQISGIIWDQMLRSYMEAKESAVATFLNTLTSATDITLTGRPAASPTNANDQTTVGDLKAAIAQLQFARGGNRFSAFAVQNDLYALLARVTDTAGRELFPMINPMNANGTAQALYTYINVSGTTAVPAWALGAGGQTTAQNSWLFDPAKVLGWASAPDRLDWDFGATVQTNNVTQLAFVTMGIYGDVALGNTDINGVRQVVFDPSV